MRDTFEQTAVLTGVVPAWLDWIDWQDSQLQDLAVSKK